MYFFCLTSFSFLFLCKKDMVFGRVIWFLTLYFCTTSCAAQQEKQGLGANAISLLNEKIAKDPKNPALYLQRAHALDSSKSYLKALADVNALLKLDEKNIEAYYLRGMLKMKLDDASGAVNDFNKIILLDPKNANAYYQRGIIRLEVRDKSGACSEFKKALEYKHPKAQEMLTKHCK